MSNLGHSASEDELDALVLHVDDDVWLRGATFGPMLLTAALPRLNDNELRAVVHQATAAGLFFEREQDRLSLSLEGRRRAQSARVKRGIADAFTRDWNRLPDMTLADAVLLVGKNISENRKALWVEDLYVAFRSTDMGALKGSVTELRERGLLAPIDIAKMRKFTSTGFFKDFDHAWASGFTREGIRRAVLLSEREDVRELMVPQAVTHFVERIQEQYVDEDLAVFLRAIPRGLRELAPGHRREGRQPFVVTDEYDLQDFVRAYLRMRFPKSLKPEESMPSVSSKGGRVDFVVGELQCFVELKVFQSEPHWRTTMMPDITSKIERYGQDARCDVLYVLVYDPNQAFRAAAATEVEMSKERVIGDKRFRVQLVVTPQT